MEKFADSFPFQEVINSSEIYFADYYFCGDLFNGYL